MKVVVVSIRDSAAEVYGQPQYVSAVGVAVRGFTDQINRNEPGNVMFAHPEHFDLLKLGTFDDATGVFENESPVAKVLAIGKHVAVRDEVQLPLRAVK